MTRVTNPTVVDIRRANRASILRHIYQSESVSRQELIQLTGLSSASVTNVVAELLQEEIVVESGLEAAPVGRPRSMLAINLRYGSFIGVEMGDTHIHIELFDLMMRKLGATTSALTLSETSPEYVVELIQQGVLTVLEAADLTIEHVLGIGVSVGGIVEQVEQVFVNIPAWEWRRIPLGMLLKQRLPVPIYLDNAAKVMVQAESLFGAGQGYKHLAVLLVETGIGAGIIADGSLYRGAGNSAGEWGHMTIVPDGRPCRCGSYGCLEAYVGAPGIIASLRELPGQSSLQHLDQETTLAALFEAARGGDANIAQRLKKTGHFLGLGIANLINLFNPQLILLGGWVGLQLGEHILPDVREAVERYALKQPLSQTKIELCQLGLDAVAMGAATLVLEDFLTLTRRPVTPSLPKALA